MHSFVKRWNEPRLELKNWTLGFVRTAPYAPCFILAESNQDAAAAQIQEARQLHSRSRAVSRFNAEELSEAQDLLQDAGPRLRQGKFSTSRLRSMSRSDYLVKNHIILSFFIIILVQA